MPRALSKQQKKVFQQTVADFFALHRRKLPWRNTRDPYRILVSEVMLQQTQVSRVIEKYQLFLKRFPTIKQLAAAPKREVLAVWSGLGYNRRALMLQRTAQEVMVKYNGKLPRDTAKLEALFGIGPYTASAVLVFAYNQPAVMIETNIRTVYLHHFFADKKQVPDQDIIPLITQTLNHKNPREWYYALMDYGSFLKKTIENPSRKSAHHTKQSAFIGSRRQARGAIIRLLTQNQSLTKKQLEYEAQLDPKLLHEALGGLIAEKVVGKKQSRYFIS